MDRKAIARAGRRQQALEALEFERTRETELQEELAERIAEVEGPRLDEEVFARLEPSEVELIRETLAGPGPAMEAALGEDAEAFDFGVAYADLGDEESPEEEIARLEQELDECRRRQRAFERYLEALGG